jgi:hypothetical protein
MDCFIMVGGITPKQKDRNNNACYFRPFKISAAFKSSMANAFQSSSYSTTKILSSNLGLILY